MLQPQLSRDMTSMKVIFQFDLVEDVHNMNDV